MKTITFLKLSFFALLSSLMFSCNDDDNNNITPTADSREVRYEVTGNAIGTYDIAYISGSNTGASAIPSSLPWTKDIVAQSGSFAATLNATVFSATPGQTLTARIYVGGVLKKQQTETVQANGIAVIASLQYVLQ